MADTSTPGVIERFAVYTLAEFKRRTRMADWAIRTARRNGLVIDSCGNRRFIRGTSFEQYLAKRQAHGEADK